MLTTRIHIKGYVQGIGFRQFIRKNAVELGVFGYVRNLSDGSVEVLFQSSKRAKIEKLISLCKKGPFLASVKDLEVKWLEDKASYLGFEVIS